VGWQLGSERKMPKNKKGRKARVTLKDVAAASSVSVMTVSNVINNKDNFVGIETRKRVKEAIAALNYRPNLSARSLRVAREFSVGAVIVDPDPDFLNDPFNTKLLSGLSNHLSRSGYTLDIQGVMPDQFDNAAILRRNRNDAFCAILCGPKEQRKNYISHLQQLRIPTVIFQETFRLDSEDIIFLNQNDLDGGRMLGQHIASKKIKSVVFVKPFLEWAAIEKREQGIREAFEKSGQDIEFDTLVTPSESFEDVYDSVHNYLSRRMPDTLMASTDAMGVAALRAAEDSGIKIPTHMRMTAYNGFDIWQYVKPTLTTVISPAYEMGRLASELILDRLMTGTFKKKFYTLPVEFKEGESS